VDGLLARDPAQRRAGRRPLPSRPGGGAGDARFLGELRKREDAIHSQGAVGRLALPEQVARIIAFVPSGSPDFMTDVIVDVKESPT